MAADAHRIPAGFSRQDFQSRSDHRQRISGISAKRYAGLLAGRGGATGLARHCYEFSPDHGTAIPRAADDTIERAGRPRTARHYHDSAGATKRNTAGLAEQREGGKKSETLWGWVEYEGQGVASVTSTGCMV